MNICYVILHYKNIKETIKCVRSLFETASSNSKIIIVDNGSNDGSGTKLQSLFGEDSRCKIILLDTNVGFSKGNNVGYIYAKKYLDPDYIVVTNNDVVFNQCDFEKKINDIYLRTKFDVLGPDVYIPNNKEHQSPIFLRGITSEELEKELEEYRYYQSNPEQFKKRLKLHFLKNRICSQSLLLRRLYSKIRGKEYIDYRREYNDVVLQGCCLIVSRQFVEKEEKMFDPEPFLYCEETLLYYRCKKKQYTMIYSPEIKIKHEESASFKNATKNTEERLKFMLKHHVIARELLLDYIVQYEKNQL